MSLKLVYFVLYLVLHLALAKPQQYQSNSYNGGQTQFVQETIPTTYEETIPTTYEVSDFVDEEIPITSYDNYDTFPTTYEDSSTFEVVDSPQKQECKREFQTVTEVIYEQVEEDVCSISNRRKCELVPQRKCTPQRQRKCRTRTTQECQTRVTQQCADVFKEVSQPYTDSECWEEVQNCPKIPVDVGYGVMELISDPKCPFHLQVSN